MGTPVQQYRGRFAPSPTGPLHFGSLVGALASYLDARQNQGQWLVRIEDIDPLREKPGAASLILYALEAHGLLWDEEVTYQSSHNAHYEQVVQQLLSQNSAYRCPCSRKDLQQGKGHHTAVCLSQQFALTAPHAIRFKVDQEQATLPDLIQDRYSQRLQSPENDFVIRRKEGFYAYQLAVVVDDHRQRISHVVRGIDLIESTPLQRQLFRSLDWQPPNYAHFPVVVDATGGKLSKQRLSPALDSTVVMANLTKAALALQLIQPEEMLADTPVELVNALVTRWQRQRYSGITKLAEPGFNAPSKADTGQG